MGRVIKEFNGNKNGTLLMALSFWYGGMDTLRFSEIKNIVKKANLHYISITTEKPFVMISGKKPKRECWSIKI